MTDKERLCFSSNSEPGHKNECACFSLCKMQLLLAHPLTEGVAPWGISALYRFSPVFPIQLGSQVVLCSLVQLFQDGQMLQDFTFHLSVSKDYTIQLIQQMLLKLNFPCESTVFFQVLGQDPPLSQGLLPKWCFICLKYCFHRLVHMCADTHTPLTGVSSFSFFRSDFKHHPITWAFPNCSHHNVVSAVLCTWAFSRGRVSRIRSSGSQTWCCRPISERTEPSFPVQ